MIELKDVSYVYAEGSPYETAALSDISLTIGEGEFVGIIGHTGSGKSTLVNIMSGVVKPTKGSVLIDGEDITKLKGAAKKLSGKVGIVFQYPEYQLFEETVYDDIAYGPKNMGLDEMEVDKRVREAAEITDIPEELFKKSPFELSGGQKRRVAIAGILSMNPKILILDEPAAGLDPEGRREIIGQIKRMHSEYAITVILVSHSMEDVAELCEKAVFISEGKIVRYGFVNDIFCHSDELSENGLSVPEITAVMTELKKRGLDVRDDMFRLSDAVDEISRIFGGEER